MPDVDFRYLLLGMLAIGLVYACITDIRSRLIENWLTAAIALGAPLFWWASGMALQGDVLWQLGMGAITFAVLAGLFFMGWIGGGDVKLLAALALPLSGCDKARSLIGDAGGLNCNSEDSKTLVRDLLQQQRVVRVTRRAKPQRPRPEPAGGTRLLRSRAMATPAARRRLPRASRRCSPRIIATATAPRRRRSISSSFAISTRTVRAGSRSSVRLSTATTSCG